MEGIYGKSLGKMALSIKVVHQNGTPINLVHAPLESLKKALLLPLNCLVGWILYAMNKQRFFNYLTDSIIVKDKN